MFLEGTYVVSPSFDRELRDYPMPNFVLCVVLEVLKLLCSTGICELFIANVNSFQECDFGILCTSML